MIILVAEDGEDTRELMRLLLQLHGHEVFVAADGEEALTAATNRKPDIVLMDLNMPVMDGFAATRALRDHPATSKVPIVAVSAYLTDKSWCDRAIAAGCDDCVAKPVDFDALDRVLARFAPAE